MRNKFIIAISFFLSFNSFANIRIEKIAGIAISSGKEEVFETAKLDKELVVFFISKDCPCSKGNFDYLNELSRAYPEFKFLGVHSQKGIDEKEVKKYLSDKNIYFEILVDLDLAIAKKFNALKTPHVFILNLAGELIYSGGVTNSTFPKNAKDFYLKNALEDLKNHRKISKSETRTLGCFIVR